MKIGVFLARMQPLHKAHLAVINIALQECDEVVVVLGSSNKVDMLRNPYTLELRKQLLNEALGEEAKRVRVFEIPDWGFENDTNETKLWGRYFYYNIVSRIEHKHFTLYYSDGQERLDSWFKDTEVTEFIAYRLLERNNMFDGLSATKIRNAFLSNDKDYIAKYCPKSVMDKYDYLRSYYVQVHQNPKSDFAMG